MDDCLDMSNKRIKLYVYNCYLCAIFWAILPISYGDRSLPLNCWYPFDYKVSELLFFIKNINIYFIFQKPFVYEIVYFLQFVAQLQVAASFSASSGFHMVLSILISGQYDILFCSLKNILATVAITRNAPKRELRFVIIVRLHRYRNFQKILDISLY